MTELESAIMEVVAAVRAYLPPDGIDKDTLINRVIEAVDNPAINPIIKRIESE